MYDENETIDAEIYLDFNVLGKLLTTKSIREGDISLTQDIKVKSVELEEQNGVLHVKCQIKQNYLN